MALLQDTFTDANSTALGSHTMNVGSGWTAHAGTWQVQSNQAKLTTTTPNGCATADSGQANVVITVDCVVPSGLTYLLGVVGRFTDASNMWMFAIERDATTPYLAIIQRTSGTNTVRAQTNMTGATGTTVTLTVVLSGTSLTVTASTGESVNYSSSSMQSNTRHGLYGFGDLSYDPGSLDNFSVVGYATIYTAVGPTRGPVGAESANFTVTLDSLPNGTVVVTPAATGVTFAPTTLSFSGVTTSLTFTANAAASGSKTISFSDNGGLTDPSSVGYEAVTTTTKTLLVDNVGTPGVEYQLLNTDGTYFSEFNDTGVTDLGLGSFSVAADIPDDYVGFVRWKDDDDMYATEDLANYEPSTGGGGLLTHPGMSGGFRG